MPDTVLTELQRGLLEKNIIDINTSEPGIDGRTFEYVREALMWLRTQHSPDITLQFTSDGGDLSAALDIYDLIRLYSGRVDGLVMSRAQSGAVVILQACARRRCARHAGILIHGVRQYVRYEDEFDAKLSKKMRHRFRESMGMMDTILAARSRQTVPFIRRLYRKEELLSSPRALAVGLIDEIV